MMNSNYWLPSSLVYSDLDNEFDHHAFDDGDFDAIEEPPPVHIIYPRPSSQPILQSLNLKNVICFQTILLASNLFWLGR